ncbi:MAG TPA: peptidyl-prolyl cis-trans isomerase [Micropepsaceae bacterium]|jgi:peptidylprolyl isomerase/peptidyl-prolyl cis-trans isomerase C
MDMKTPRPPSLPSRLFGGLRYRPPRGVAVPLAGAFAGLAIALFNLLGPGSRPVSVVPAGYAALVNQRPILMSDFINQTETIESTPFAETTPEQRRAVLHSMIDEELMVQRALVLDLPEQDTDVRKELVDAVGAVILARKTPTDADLMAYFNAHRSNYAGVGEMRFHDIVLHFGGSQDADQSLEQAEADAHEAVYQLRSGAPLESVMQHFGFVDSGKTDSTMDDLDFAVKLHLGEKLFNVAAKLTDGEVSEPVDEVDGVHVLVMEERKPPRPAEFAVSRNQVYTDYRRDQQLRAEQDNLKFLRANAQILLAPGQSQ